MREEIHDTEVRDASAIREATDGKVGTGAAEPTDVHRTKIPPDDPRLRIERPRSRTLRKGPAILALVAVVAVGVIALAVAFSSSSGGPDSKAEGAATEVNSSSVTLPDVIKDPPPWGDAAVVGADRTAASPPSDSLSEAAVTHSAQQSRAEEVAKARGSSLFAPMDESPAAEKTVVEAPKPPTGGGVGPTVAATTPAGESGRADPNLQERKSDFLEKAGAGSAEYLERTLTQPLSTYEVKAGTVIPTVLVTGINSDLPGKIVGQVRENVYDSVTGNHLLIPQGSRLIASYDSMVAWGQERVLVCWQRLIRPDGSSLALECMPGVDLAGSAGQADEVDNHWWKMVSGAGLSSLLAATAQRSQGDVTGFQPTFPQVWANNAAGQVNQAGQQLTQKSLQIQPTITVRPGFSVNVLVSKDIVLPPYARSGVAP